MKRSHLLRVTELVAMVSATALLVAGCAAGSSTSATDASEVTTGLVGEQPDGGDPVSGGTLSYATYNAVSSLDPEAVRAMLERNPVEFRDVH